MRSFIKYLHISLCKCGRQVNHKDGHKFNNFVGNLEWVTREENIHHAYAAGLQKTGVQHPDAKIKDESVIIYIRDNPDNLSVKELAEKFGLVTRTINQIQTGEIWKEAGGTVRQAKPKKQSPPARGEIQQKILEDWRTGNFTQEQLARRYGFSRSTIQRIIKRSE